MRTVDLIMELSKLPPELEVVYDGSMNGDGISFPEFRLVVIDTASEIIDNKEQHWILLYQKSMLPEDIDSEEEE
jgi:hypothetical protein